MSIIDSLKRLERAGSETSRVTEKLREAAKDVAERIIAAVPEDLWGTSLPRGYWIMTVTHRQFAPLPFLYVGQGGEAINGCGGYYAEISIPHSRQSHRARPSWISRAT